MRAYSRSLVERRYLSDLNDIRVPTYLSVKTIFLIIGGSRFWVGWSDHFLHRSLLSNWLVLKCVNDFLAHLRGYLRFDVVLLERPFVAQHRPGRSNSFVRQCNGGYVIVPSFFEIA